MAYTDITFIWDRRFVIRSEKHVMHVYGGIFAIPPLGKDIVLTPGLIWYQPRSIWIIRFHIFMDELSFALSFYRVKLDPVFSACNLLDGFQSVKHTLRGGMGYH